MKTYKVTCKTYRICRPNKKQRTDLLWMKQEADLMQQPVRKMHVQKAK